MRPLKRKGIIVGTLSVNLFTMSVCDSLNFILFCWGKVASCRNSTVTRDNHPWTHPVARGNEARVCGNRTTNTTTNTTRDEHAELNGDERLSS